MSSRPRQRFLLFFWIVHSAFGFSSWFGGSADDQIDPDNSLVSAVVNRELETSVVASAWPFVVDNIYCEAWAFHGLKDWGYMDRFVELMRHRSSDSAMDVQQAVDIAVEATLNNPALLQYSLSLRANSPLCEMHRSLARQIVLLHPNLVSQDSFCVLRQNQIATTPSELAHLLQQDGNAVSADDGMEDLLPDEDIRGQEGSVIVLYANLGSTLFLDLYKVLVESNHRFVVRHRGHVSFEEVGGVPTILQGYGVRLDIRDVEYRSFDDSSAGKINESRTTLYALTNHSLASAQSLLLKHLEESDSEKFQEELWRLHDAQQLHSQLVPPKEQRSQLALQAAIVISRARDVLVTLQDVSQNFPSVASTLAEVVVTKEMKKLSELLEPSLGHSKGVILTINGRRVPVGRPSFNVFELLKMLQEEQQALDEMQLKLGPYLSLLGLKQVQRAWNMGKDSFLNSLTPSTGKEEIGLIDSVRRIDVGRGWQNRIIYVNDLEKDPIYREWPRSVTQALMSMQFGAPPAVRRNLFTLLCVFDPIAEGAAQHSGFALGNQLVQAHYPARIGYLIVNNKDLTECRAWIESNGISDQDISCPTKPILTKDQASMDMLATVEGSTHAIHRLVSKIATRYAGQGLAMSFMEYFVQNLEYYATDEKVMSMENIVTVFGQLMEGMGAMKMKDALHMAIQTLQQDDEEIISSYGASLRFAINKSISPGMGFINGRPLPLGSTADPGEVFAEEQNHVFGLIMKGEITDTSPKSVYGALLKGEGVFNRLHPLLIDSEDDLHLDLAHDFSASSLLFPRSHSFENEPDAVYIAEAITDFESPEGFTFAADFLRILDAYPDSLQLGQKSVSISIGYRIVPSPGSSQTPLCSILAHAATIGAAGMLTFFSEPENRKKTIDELLGLFPNLSAQQKDDIAKFSCSESWSKEMVTSKNFVVVNGKVYAPEALSITKEDIDLLVEIERSRSMATTSILKGFVSFDDLNYFVSIVKACTFLGIEHSKPDTSRRMDMVIQTIATVEAMGIEANPFRFSWNMDDHDRLTMQASIVIDPATQAAQRVAPFLLAFRDFLKIPLQMVLVPRSLLDGDDANIPITSYYRFVADPLALSESREPKAAFSNLPTNHILTLRLDVPESWNVQQVHSIQDTDNLRCNTQSGCGDYAMSEIDLPEVPIEERRYLTSVEYGLKSLMFFGQCYDASTQSPPNGLQLILSKKEGRSPDDTTAEVSIDGSIDVSTASVVPVVYSDTLVMKNVGYWQLRSNPGVWQLQIAPGSRGAEIYDIALGTVEGGRIKLTKSKVSGSTKTIFMKDFIGDGEMLLVNPRPGFEKASLFDANEAAVTTDNDDVIHVFSLATGHLYERFLKIMMLSVTKRTSSKVKFWLFENFLSPSFKDSAKAMANRIGCELEFVTYKWPEWLRGQSEKQRIIWGYKILFLDVLFPLNVKKIIYVDADQVVRGDLKELWDLDLEGAPYGYTPMCSSRESTLGFQFWRGGFWEQHLRGKPYHISALYVVDLEKFRMGLVGDNLRALYQQLSADPNSLANLDQDLPNYAQHQVPIFSLPQEWLWCESWCSDDTKATAKTIDLCNNPLHKEPKVNMAKRIISGALFEESWVELDAEVEGYEKDYFAKLAV